MRNFSITILRHFLIILLLLLGHQLNGQEAIVKIDGQTIPYTVLFDASDSEDIACYRIPALAVAPNGDLIAVIDERVPSCGDLKWSDDINIVIRRSTDNGGTWTGIERIVDYPIGQSASDPSIIVDEETGIIFLFYNYMDLENERDVYYLKYKKSMDNGQSWSEPIDITHQISKPEWKKDFKFITSGRGIQTSTGKLIHTLVNLDNGLHLFESDDHGENWKLLNTPLIPGNESKVVELSDGSWMVNCRYNGSGYRFIHQSDNGGSTWSSRPDTTLVDPGCNASILSITRMVGGNRQDILLFANANHTDKRKNLTIRASLDQGMNWNKGTLIYDGMAAYSSMVQLSDGTIGLFFEKDEYQENVFVRIELREVLGD